MKNKKGFTLIELLAVLVVLAILALISIPIVIKIINNARENSYKRSIVNYAKAFELAIANDSMDNSMNDYKALTDYEIEDMYSGNRVQCDLNSSSIESGKLILRYCHVNNSKYYKYENSNVVEETLYDDYEIGATFTLNNDLYYVIKNSSSIDNYVVALKDTPLTATEITTAGGSTSASENDIGTMAYYTSENCNLNNTSGCNNISYGMSNVKSVVDAWALAKFQNNELKTVDGYSARLINIAELERLGYVYNANNGNYPLNSNVPSWVYNSYYYLTMSSTGSFHVWAVSQYHIFGIDVRDDSGVVRPVINVYKSAIQK